MWSEFACVFVKFSIESGDKLEGTCRGHGVNMWSEFVCVFFKFSIESGDMLEGTCRGHVVNMWSEFACVYVKFSIESGDNLEGTFSKEDMELTWLEPGEYLDRIWRDQLDDIESTKRINREHQGHLDRT